MARINAGYEGAYFESQRDIWDLYHPAEANEDDFGDEEGDLEPLPAVPTIDTLPPLVDYSSRGPNDFVVSGPLVKGNGPGRLFGDELKAFNWAAGKYGQSRVSRSYGGENRWAVLIKAV